MATLRPLPNVPYTPAAFVYGVARAVQLARRVGRSVVGHAEPETGHFTIVSVGLKQFQMSPEMRPGDEARNRSNVRVSQKRQFRGARQPSRTQPIEIGATSSSQPISIRATVKSA